MTHATFHDLAGKTVFISGGGAGIGAALTRGFAAQGAKVGFVQRSDATAFCASVEADFGTRPMFIQADVTDIDALTGAMDRVRDAFGPIRVLINNAAQDKRVSVDDMDVAEWDHLQNVNLRHHFFAAKAVRGDMAAAGGGVIVNYGSISHMLGLEELAAYTAAKAGIEGLTRSLARGFGGDGIRVNCLLPGWILTDRQRRDWATPESIAAHVDRQSLKRELAEDDVVGPTLFLASDVSGAMTGQTMIVDGGMMMR